MNFLQKLKTDKSLLIAFGVLGMVILLRTLFSSSEEKDTPKESAAETLEVDTMIPAGYLLIPLQLSNAESLASLSGPFAVVDLYAQNEKGRKSFKVAGAVKLLRAPLNPQQFAVLVREEESARLMSQEGPFFAALKNPKEMAKKSPQKTMKNPVIISYGE